MSTVLGGQIAAEEIAAKIKTKIEETWYKGVPKLAVILVGNNPASESYVKNKVKLFQKAGAECEVIRFEETVSKITLESCIINLNLDDHINGIILQLPAPFADSLIPMIKPEKDVDGFIQGSGFIPCTPLGVLNLLKHYNIETEGKDIVILGRSIEVGKPLAQLLSSKDYNATVTLCHSKTKNLEEHICRADIVISAIGKPEFITADMIKDNAICIDIGINRVPDSSKKSGFRLCGDFKINDALINKCDSYTPTPGGTGPMTVAALLEQTYKAFLIQNNLEGDKNV